MDINKIRFIGKLECIKNVEKTLQEIPENTFNCREIEARVGIEEIFIYPADANEEIDIVTIPKEA